MIKRILLYLVIITLVFIVFSLTHKFFLEGRDMILSFSLFPVYFFHLIASAIVYIVIELVADKMPTQAGYVYLASIFLKLGFFVLIFKASVLSVENLKMFERITLVIPLFLFLLVEAISVSKLLNNK